MKAYVGVTDGDWYRFLAARPAISEVNFWRPASNQRFRVLSVGEPFLFKSHFPHNRVVGGGFYSGFVPLRISEAWEFFGEGNGVADVTEMRRKVGQYRKQPIAASEDPIIGCVLIRDAVFFPPQTTAEPPPDFASNIVQGKGYDLATHHDAGYFKQVIGRLLGGVVEVDLVQPWHRSGPVFGDPRLTPVRLGQQSFQAVVLDAYARRCAVTGDKVRPVLQAAHIRPVSRGGEHRIDNALLLRSDIHTLYDRGYIGVNTRHQLEVSPRLREEFGNGDLLYAKAGSVVGLPEHKRDRPNREFLEWHMDTVYQAA